MNYSITKFFGIVLVSTLPLSAGCSFLFGEEGVFPDRSNAYLKSDQSEPLVLPEGVTADVSEESYQIPELQ